MPRVPVKVVTWDEIVEWSRILANKILEAGYKPDIVIAIARGGYVPARLLCDFLGVENLISIQSQHWTEAAKMAEKAILKFEYTLDLSNYKALLVDDIVDTGDSLILAKNFILEKWKPKELKIATLQWISPVAKIKPDFYAIEVREWVWFQYPWTALEDITQFIKRVVNETGRKRWTLNDLLQAMEEWYGSELVEKRFNYIKLALENLVKSGFFKLVKQDDVTIYEKT